MRAPGRIGIASLRRGMAATALLFAAGGISHAQTKELLVNGGFETGDLTGWTAADLAGSYSPGSFVIGNNTLDNTLTPPSPSTPISQLPTVGSASGSYYAVSDSLGPGTHALIQNFTVPVDSTGATLAFRMFVNDWYGAGALNANGPLDHNQLDSHGNPVPTQFARVDLLAGNASDFDTGAGVLKTFYLGEDAGNVPNAYTSYQFDISSLVADGSSYRLRFAEVDNQFTINQGVDNVSITADVAAIPECQPVILLVTGLAGIMVVRKKRVLLSAQLPDQAQ